MRQIRKAQIRGRMIFRAFAHLGQLVSEPIGEPNEGGRDQITIVSDAVPKELAIVVQSILTMVGCVD